ncbi:DUF6963 family protein [Falsigemmobacter faecalis]|uniref:Uncharacterized protein n=1 Tax=Falsigemmobacter faecalis TaxID=2488730 RepID=A0A3P3DVN5_9RHOB|nr:hypothetical protein [Falsigemmobacter faecalis]RRH78225.1 hypothetical protein EG244_01925 [Falsigemmobacter faecalis]
MTTGIAIRGPGAGQAVLRVLQALEMLGVGEIGGFAVFRALKGAEGALLSAVTQRRGSAGLALPPGWQGGDLAAVISSGPDRPLPLEQFLPAGPEGLVTGHRLPSSLTAAGEPLNASIFRKMAEGRLDQGGLTAALAAEPGLDAGLIVLPRRGPVLLSHAPRVAARGDCGSFLWQAGDLAVAVVLNSIAATGLSADALAEAVGRIGIEALGGARAGYGTGHLPDRLCVTPATDERVDLDASGLVCALRSANPAFQRGRPGITAIYSGTPVWQEGAPAGVVISEVWADAEAGWLSAGPARQFIWQRRAA